ncbi:MAG TPA: chromate efflux transporter [Anaeromyxobacteraceae bacterium]|nr:chromate efflux transporter [Anaeromyxobacteraceae bacterium]
MDTLVPGTTWERSAVRPHPTVLDLVRFGLWMGMVGFGGGLSVLAGLREATVERRRWLTAREFDNTATVAQMLPGGAAANALSLLGLRNFGLKGAFMTYAAFILPGFGATVLLAALYGTVGGASEAGALLGGFSAAVVGIVASITLQMVGSSVGRFWQMGIAAMALALSLAGGASSGEIALLGIGSGLVLDLATKRARLARARRSVRGPASPRRRRVALPDEGEPLPRTDRSSLRAVALPIAMAALLATMAGGTLVSLALLFLRTGLGAYGGGFAIVPHLHATLVGNGVLSERQFTDAVAIGKLTPGPVLLMATFIGYVKSGVAGALVSTAAIFAAPFMLTVALGGWLARYRSRRAVRAALRGLTPAVVGTIAAAAITLAGGLRGPGEIAIAVAVGLTLTRFRVNPVFMLAVGGAAKVLLLGLGVA